MGLEVPLIAALVGGAVVGNKLAPKAPQPPAPPPVPDAVAAPEKAEEKLYADGERAAAQQKKRATAAAATGSTILTGSQGLGELGDDNKSKKSLLGY
jgi:hypothetical protein